VTLFSDRDFPSHLVEEIQQKRDVDVPLLLLGPREHGEALAVRGDIERRTDRAQKLLIGSKEWLGVGKRIALGCIVAHHELVQGCGKKLPPVPRDHTG